MRKLLNAKWLLLTNTLPIIFLLFLEWSEFQIIKSLLSEESISLWTTFSMMLVILAIGNLIYACIQIIKKKRIGILYCVTTLAIYSIFIYSYYYLSDDIIPFSIPRWMVSGNLFLYVGTFLMPTLMHSLFALVVLLTPHSKSMVAWKNIVAAIAIPLLFYIFGIVIAPLWSEVAFGNIHLVLIFTIVATAAFLFFLLRFVYIIMSQKDIYEHYQLVWKIPISLIFPIVGLTLNNNTFSNLFGDFTSIWFYIIAILNAIVICLPNPKNKQLRLLLFGLRCVTFMYTFYFFLVMLPFFPLSIFAIILVGAGFLMLTPLILFPIHLNELAKDFKYLKKIYKKQLLYIIAIIGILVLPIATTISYIQDRTMLHKTLEYLYSPDYSKEYKLDAISVTKTINSVKNRGRNDVTLYGSTPYLSSFYKWLVLDNLNISESKKQKIEELFNGSKNESVYETPSRRNNDTVDIKITDIKHNSKYDSKQKAWISRIDLSITNGNTARWNSEYITNIDLPLGCWISNYYLYVDSIKEMGILAEKKAATWVFSQIRNENKDPGLLRYLSGNKVEFKVFPFNIGETRYTGIEFIHKEPVEINIDGNLVALGDHQTLINNRASTNKGEVVYISTTDKQNLKTVKRNPYYHFIVDISSNTPNKRIDDGSEYSTINEKSKKDTYIDEIKDLISKNLIDKNNAKISYTNTYVTTSLLDNNWENELRSKELEGGFFLVRAIKKIMFDAYMKPSNSYPIIVVVSNTLEKAILFNDLSNMQFTCPESNLFYSLKSDSLRAHSFSSGIRTINHNVNIIPSYPVKAWPNASDPAVFIANDNNPSIVLNTKNKTLDIKQEDITDRNWESGLMMQAQWMLQILHPETADKEWLNLLQNSFKSGIMTPLTSYIVVENEAQKAILKKKQEQVMSGNRSLDLNDDTQAMSEPNIFILILAFGLFYILYRKRKLRHKTY